VERRRGARTEARVAGNGDPRRPALQDDREEKDQAKGGVRVDRSRSPAPAREADTAQALGNQETRPGATPVDRGGNTTSFTRWVEGIRESQEGCGDRTSTVRSEHLSDGAAFPLRSGSVAHPRGWVDREGHGREGSGEGRATVRSAPFADRSLPDGASEPTRRPVRIHGENRLVSSRRTEWTGEKPEATGSQVRPQGSTGGNVVRGIEPRRRVTGGAEQACEAGLRGSRNRPRGRRGGSGNPARPTAAVSGLRNRRRRGCKLPIPSTKADSHPGSRECREADSGVADRGGRSVGRPTGRERGMTAGGQGPR
jgi:hypothetical protein